MANFALVVFGKKAVSEGGAVIAEDGQRFLVLDEPDGWVEATSTRFRPSEILPGTVKTWRSRKEASSFAKRWKGHPWWCEPNGAYEVLELVPVTAVVGYKLKQAAASTKEPT